jgi:hypothetical protein
MLSFCILILLTAVGLLAATSGNLRESSVSSSLLPLFVKDIIATTPLQYLSTFFHGIRERTTFTPQNIVTYSLTSTFDDGSCTSLITSVATQIKQCYKSAGNYTRTTSVLATGKVPTITTTKTNYRDSACTKVIGWIDCLRIGARWLRPIWYFLWVCFSFNRSRGPDQVSAGRCCQVKDEWSSYLLPDIISHKDGFPLNRPTI